VSPRRKRPAPKPGTPAAAAAEWVKHERLCETCTYERFPCGTGMDLRRAWEKLANKAMDQMRTWRTRSWN
jgi:hypothetical protein